MRPVVQSLWIGPELGILQQLSISSFLANACTYRLYAYEPIPGVPAGVEVCDAASIVPMSEVFRQPPGFGAGSFSGFSDVFRYQLLLEHGGWWVDTDVVCLRPLTFEQDFVFATELARDGRPATASCAIKAARGAEFLQYCADVCRTVDTRQFVWGQIGPELLDDAIWRFQLERFKVPVNCFNPVNYYEFDQFTVPGFDFSRLLEASGVHLWHQMWRSTGTDPAASWPADSLIGILKARYLGSESDS